MPKICGELKHLSPSRREGGRTIFPQVMIGDKVWQNAIAVNSDVADAIETNARLGEVVCFYAFRHLTHRMSIMGMQLASGELYAMVPKGLFGGLIWYGVISPFVVAIPAVIIGMLVGMLGGQRGTALGLLLGVLFAFGISWLTAFRFYKTYQEMRAAARAARVSAAPSSGPSVQI